MIKDRNLFELWINSLNKLSKDIKKHSGNAGTVLEKIQALKSYERSLLYFNDIEVELPEWFDEEVDGLFDSLTFMSFDPMDYRS